jgi:hypothetical protein
MVQVICIAVREIPKLREGSAEVVIGMSRAFAKDTALARAERAFTLTSGYTHV